MIVDAHCDSITICLEKNLKLSNKKLSFNIKDAEKINEPVIQILALYIPPNIKMKKEISKISEKKEIAWGKTLELLDKFKEIENEEIKIFKIDEIKKLDEIVVNKKIGVILSIENGSSICGNLSRIEFLKKQGVNLMSVTWNNDNELGCGAYTNNDTGLTYLGKKYIKELEKNDVIVDVSHSSEKTFFDIQKIAQNPIVATHSCVFNLCENKRNLKDDQIKQIAKMNGVIGICFYKKFIKNKYKIFSDDIIDHISYIANLVGVDYVGLGSDFDGVNKRELPLDMKGIKNINILKEKMRGRGFYSSEIEKIMSDNWLRILKRNEIGK